MQFYVGFLLLGPSYFPQFFSTEGSATFGLQSFFYEFFIENRVPRNSASIGRMVGLRTRTEVSGMIPDNSKRPLTIQKDQVWSKPVITAKKSAPTFLNAYPSSCRKLTATTKTNSNMRNLRSGYCLGKTNEGYSESAISLLSWTFGSREFPIP